MITTMSGTVWCLAIQAIPITSILVPFLKHCFPVPEVKLVRA